VYGELLKDEVVSDEELTAKITEITSKGRAVTVVFSEGLARIPDFREWNSTVEPVLELSIL